MTQSRAWLDTGCHLGRVKSSSMTVADTKRAAPLGISGLSSSRLVTGDSGCRKPMLSTALPAQQRHLCRTRVSWAVAENHVGAAAVGGCKGQVDLDGATCDQSWLQRRRTAAEAGDARAFVVFCRAPTVLGPCAACWKHRWAHNLLDKQMHQTLLQMCAAPMCAAQYTSQVQILAAEPGSCMHASHASHDTAGQSQPAAWGLDWGCSCPAA